MPARSAAVKETKPAPSAAALALAQEARKLGGGTSELARRLRAHESTVRSWITGRAKPSGAVRASIAAVCGIRADAWDQAPGANAKAPAKRAVELPPRPVIHIGASALERTRAQVVNLEADINRARSSGISYRELSSLENSYAMAVKQLAKLTGETEITEAAILRSPAFARCMRVLREVLEARAPDALAELAERLERLANDGG